MKVKLFFATMSLFLAFTLSAQEARYEIKSGILKRSMDMMGQKIESTVYFDDYGKVESSTMSNPMMGGEMLMISKDDETIMVNLQEKQAFRIQMNQNPVNFLNLTQAAKDANKVKELGEEDVAGKKCKKYSYETSQRGQANTVTAWVWKGIMLKQVASANGMDMTIEVTDIQENATIPADKITIPAGITVQEMQF